MADSVNNDVSINPVYGDDYLKKVKTKQAEQAMKNIWDEASARAEDADANHDGKYDTNDVNLLQKLILNLNTCINKFNLDKNLFGDFDKCIQNLNKAIADIGIGTYKSETQRQKESVIEKTETKIKAFETKVNEKIETSNLKEIESLLKEVNTFYTSTIPSAFQGRNDLFLQEEINAKYEEWFSRISTLEQNLDAKKITLQEIEREQQASLAPQETDNDVLNNNSENLLSIAKQYRKDCKTLADLMEKRQRDQFVEKKLEFDRKYYDYLDIPEFRELVEELRQKELAENNGKAKSKVIHTEGLTLKNVSEVLGYDITQASNKKTITRRSD